MKKQSIVTGALILTAAGIITRVLGFVYRIYLSNTIGAEGVGLYQLIMPVYGLAWSIACSGFNTTVSKLVAAENARGEVGNMNRILKQSVAITSVIGVALGAALFFAAGPVARVLFRDERTVLALRILSLAFPFMAAGTSIRGYFLGLREMVVPAINQVLEQCVRMGVIFALAGFFIPMGLEYACAVCIIGIVCEEAVSFLYIAISYRMFKSRNSLNKRPTLASGQTLAMIASMALPIMLTRVSGSLLSAAENVLIPLRLEAHGMSASQAVSMFGQVTGMAMPLVYFPTALLTSLSITLVPAVAEAVAAKRENALRGTVTKSILFAFIAGIGAACLFTVFPRELGTAIYNQPIGDMLLVIGLMCPFLYLQIVLSGVLNGLGFQVFIFRNSLLSSAINILFIYFLVPVSGVYAFLLGWFLSLALVCALEVNKIRRSIPFKIDAPRWFLKPALCAGAAGLAVKWAGNRYIIPLLGAKTGLFVSVALLAAGYCAFVFLTGCIDKSDMRRLIPVKKSLAK